ncbi:hypothetical protein RZP54_17850, partial [Raoultella ornithinolytica]|nr:hypothetical protein [Raoultella ornithinolytica]
IGPDPRNFNQRVSLGRNDLLIRTFPKAELAPKNYIVPGDPAIEYVQTHSAPQPIPARINRFVTVRVA